MQHDPVPVERPAETLPERAIDLMERLGAAMLNRAWFCPRPGDWDAVRETQGLVEVTPAGWGMEMRLELSGYGS